VTIVRYATATKPAVYVPRWRPVALLSCGVLALCVSTEHGALADGATHPLVGKKAPAFSLPNQNGPGDLSVDAARDKVAVVDVWATYCEPCKKEFPRLEALSAKLGGRVVVLALSQDDSRAPIAGFVRATGVHFPVGWDQDNKIAEQYAASAMPTSFVVDQQGVVRYVHLGYHDGDDAKIEAEVASLLK